jgi:thiol:disulfide interchange protein DsbD
VRPTALALIAFALAAPWVPAADTAALPPVTAASRNVHATLLSETASLQPGQRFWIGLRLQMDPGWHVYWKQPGDSGLPPRLKWTLPAGVTAEDIAFPHPERFTAGTLASYGYTGDLLLLVPMTAAPSLAAGTVALVVNASWLECRDTCIPAKATLGLSVPVTAAAPRPAAEAALFTAARASVPRRAGGWRYESDAQHIVLRPPRGWRPPSGAAVEFFAAQDNVIVFAAPQQVVADARGWGLSLARDPNGSVPSTVQGVMVTRRGPRADAVEIDASLWTKETR